MTRYKTPLAAAALLLVACGSSDTDSDMAEMTAEEHAQHLAGGNQGEFDSTGAQVRQVVHLTAQEERAAGVKYTTVRRQALTRTIRTVGRIEVPEPNIVDITPKIDGFVEELYVGSTGEAVRRGQPLLTLYSPLLVAAQEELLTAKRMADRIDASAGEAWDNAQTMLAAARRRLEYWDITAEQVERLETTGEVTKTLTLVAPFSGIVLEKHVVEGQRVSEGARLYRLADLTEVWVEGDVFEQDLQFLRTGAQAHVEVSAYPGEHIMGRVSFVYPTVDERSRTNRVRLTVDNRDARLKPGMFATMYFDHEIGDDVLTVPIQAVIQTGERTLVFHRQEDGSLHPHEVVVGARAGEWLQVLSGLDEGVEIVAAANFLVDAESRLASTGDAMPGMQHGSVVEPERADSGQAASEHDHD
jgi:Cu(I)/Ag(I) efflux system membrane fusion protein